MHDAGIALNVMKNGKLIPLSAKTILYRQHSNNCIGAQNMDDSYVKNKLTNFKRVINENKARYKMLKELNFGSPLKYLYYKMSYIIKRTI